MQHLRDTGFISLRTVAIGAALKIIVKQESKDQKYISSKQVNKSEAMPSFLEEALSTLTSFHFSFAIKQTAQCFVSLSESPKLEWGKSSTTILPSLPERL